MNPPVLTAEQAVSTIASGDRVFVGGLACTPTSLIAALAARAPELRDVSILHLITMGDTPYAEHACHGSFRTTSFFLGANTRDAVLDNRADFVPVFLHELPRLLARRYPLDWTLVQLSPPDRHGFCTVSLNADAVLAAVRTARRVIAEINPRLPRTMGDTQIHLSRLHAIVEVDHPVPELPPPPLTQAMRAIGRNIAEMIEDGDCLQIGIGGIPNAALELIADRRRLGIHTEMLTDGVVNLHRAGAIDGSRKTILPGKIVCSFAAGLRSLYDFVDDNPLVEFHGANFTNDPYVIGQNSNVVAVNSALQIDLTGQIDADFSGHAYLFRHRRPGRFHPRRGAQRRRAADHRHPEHRERRHGEPDRAHPRARRRRGDEPRRRAPRHHRIWPGRSVRSRCARAGARPDLDRASRFPRAAQPRGPRAPPLLGRARRLIRRAASRGTSRGCCCACRCRPR